jgi:hypothetical protein
MADGRSRPATIDAAVPAPDGASSCTTRTVQLLTNGDFDQGHVGWAESTTATPVTPIIRDALPPGVSPDSGAYLAWLGGDDDSNVQAGTDTLSQDIAVPPGTTALQISGVRWVVTDQPAGEYDLLSVQLRRATDNGLEERLGDPAVSCSSTCTWANEDETTDFARFTLTPRGDYAGRTIRVVFESEVDDSFNTNFYVDSLEATATVCD